jgi:hypothetical protein
LISMRFGKRVAMSAVEWVGGMAEGYPGHRGPEIGTSVWSLWP